MDDKMLNLSRQLGFALSDDGGDEPVPSMASFHDLLTFLALLGAEKVPMLNVTHDGSFVATWMRDGAKVRVDFGDKKIFVKPLPPRIGMKWIIE